MRIQGIQREALLQWAAREKPPQGPGYGDTFTKMLEQTPGRDSREMTLRAQSEARKARSMHNHCLTGFGLSWMTMLGSAVTLATGHVGHLGPLVGIAAGALGVAASVGGARATSRQANANDLFVTQLQDLEKIGTP